MTIVVAMKESDESILIGADSEATSHTGFKSRVVKLALAPNYPIAWGTAGNPTIGIYEFGEWAKQYEWDGKDWQTASADAIEALSRFNGHQRWLTVELAKAELGQGFLADCILVGWLGGEPGMFALSDDGRISRFWERGFQAIGTGENYATAAYNTILVASGARNEQAMKLILHGAVTYAPNCGPPAECWRVTPSGVMVAFKLETRLEDITNPGDSSASQSKQGSNEQ